MFHHILPLVTVFFLFCFFWPVSKLLKSITIDIYINTSIKHPSQLCLHVLGCVKPSVWVTFFQTSTLLWALHPWTSHRRRLLHLLESLQATSQGETGLWFSHVRSLHGSHQLSLSGAHTPTPSLGPQLHTSLLWDSDGAALYFAEQEARPQQLLCNQFHHSPPAVEQQTKGDLLSKMPHHTPLLDELK